MVAALPRRALRLRVAIPYALAALNSNLGFGCYLLCRPGGGFVAAFIRALLAFGPLRRPGLRCGNLVEFIAPCPRRLLQRAAAFLPLPILDPALFDERHFERLALALLD